MPFPLAFTLAAAEGKGKLNVYERKVKPGISFRDVAKGHGGVVITDAEMCKTLEEGSKKGSSTEEEVFENFGSEKAAPGMEDDKVDYAVKVINGKSVVVFKSDSSEMSVSTSSKKRNRDMVDDDNMAEAAGEDGSESSAKMSKK